MSKFLFPALALVAASVLPSCGTHHHKITLRDGREFIAANQPELNRKTGYYKFRGLSDKDALLRADEVLMINEM